MGTWLCPLWGQRMEVSGQRWMSGVFLQQCDVGQSLWLTLATKPRGGHWPGSLERAESPLESWVKTTTSGLRPGLRPSGGHHGAQGSGCGRNRVQIPHEPGFEMLIVTSCWQLELVAGSPAWTQSLSMCSIWRSGSDPLGLKRLLWVGFLGG